MDKKFKIRKEAMEGLALIYNKHLTNPGGVPQATKNAVKWIKDKLLHGYYTPGKKITFHFKVFKEKISLKKSVTLFLKILYTPNSN